MYKITINEKEFNFLKNKIPRNIGQRILNKLEEYKELPLFFFERLTGVKLYKLRVGDYRVIADIDVKNKAVKVVLIGHRKNIYRKVEEFDEQ